VKFNCFALNPYASDYIGTSRGPTLW